MIMVFVSDTGYNINSNNNDSSSQFYLITNMFSPDTPHGLPICISSSMFSSVNTLFGLRTNGVDTDGPAAKVIIFEGLGEKVRPGTFGKIKVGQREYPKSPSVRKHETSSDPISADPICPFPIVASCPKKAGTGTGQESCEFPTRSLVAAG